MTSAQRQEIESHRVFLTDLRARLESLPVIRVDDVDPEDDTFDTDEDPTGPDPAQENTHR
jgi:hypothetical protein